MPNLAATRVSMIPDDLRWHETGRHAIPVTDAAPSPLGGRRARENRNLFDESSFDFYLV
ncbi:protein of unassigned function [Methylobacterium oryzae CBMB20]|uniref:Protein of unassigned function n=1 Tax=Methylobacterium oryzae CBMB20 TaxID=693986 RepID=A0A089NXI0_9HYPH|nr:protein of unassigned function [Methylobacterium oryzae CBMB20]